MEDPFLGKETPKTTIKQSFSQRKRSLPLTITPTDGEAAGRTSYAGTKTIVAVARLHRATAIEQMAYDEHEGADSGSISNRSMGNSWSVCKRFRVNRPSVVCLERMAN